MLGKTQAASTEELVQRYAFIGSQPEGQVAAVEAAVRDWRCPRPCAAPSSALVPIGLWLLVGRARRAELAPRGGGRRGAAVAVAAAGLLALLLLVQPWRTAGAGADGPGRTGRRSRSSPGTALPEELAGVEVTTDVTTTETRRLVLSAIDTYRHEQGAGTPAAAEAAAGLELRQPPSRARRSPCWSSDRHDNVGHGPGRPRDRGRGRRDRRPRRR